MTIWGNEEGWAEAVADSLQGAADSDPPKLMESAWAEHSRFPWSPHEHGDSEITAPWVHSQRGGRTMRPARKDRTSFRTMKTSLAIALRIGAAMMLVGSAAAVTFLDTADPLHNTTTPGDNSGWQFEGKFLAYLGVPVGPFHFITAGHINGSVGDVFDFHGDLYTTVSQQVIVGTDLRVWEVNKEFPIYAPLSSGVKDVGATATVIGRGKQRGAEVFLGTVLKGWNSGTADQVQRWGRNVVREEVIDSDAGSLLICDFNNPGVAEECHLSVGDSGGGLWVLEDGLWRLAGIHYAVDGEFRVPPAGPAMRDAALFDAGGLEIKVGSNWILLPDEATNNPASFYSSRISAHAGEILAITGGGGSLPPENFNAWQKLYFTPSQLADASITGSLADPDGDGICNLLEFALNLEPGFNGGSGMTAETGLSGLPLVATETFAGEDRLTLEFVRRTAASGAGLSYAPEFSSDFASWVGGIEESVSAINSRWERVNVVDPGTTTEGRRFARLRVSSAD